MQWFYFFYWFSKYWITKSLVIKIETSTNHLLQIEDTDLIEEKSDEFLVGEKKVAIENLSSEENLNQMALEKVIGNYLFTNKTPLRDEIIATMQQRPSLKERASTTERITNKIINFVETFISGFAG